MRKEKSRMINNTIYCIKYIWKIDRKYILLMIVISILTSLFNIINLSILRYITEAITMQEMKYFLMIICLMLLLSVVIAIINGSASYLYEPLLQNRIIEKIQSDIYAKAKTFNLEEYDNEEFYDLYYFVAENGKTGILNAITLTTGILTSLTVDGEYHICERIGEAPNIGNIMDGINIPKIQEKYIDEYIEQSRKYCQNCWAAHLCGICYASCYDENGLDMDTKKIRCISEKFGIENQLIQYHEILERNPKLLVPLNEMEMN